VIAEPAVTELIELLFTTDTIGAVSTHAISIVLSVTVINIIHTIWGEQTPTYLGVERAKTVAKYCAVPLYWWTYAIYPFLIFGDWVTKATLRIFGIEMKRSWINEDTSSGKKDMRTKMVELLKTGNMDDERQKEILNALEIEHIPVKEIMIPRDEIVSLSTENSFEENLNIIRQNMHTRYPLVGKSVDDFKGILYTPQITANIKNLLEGQKKLDDFDWPKMVVSPDLPTSTLIDRFQEEHHELALVMKNEETLGLVTLTDAIEAIVGNAEDPLDLLET
tara:strand:+ start:131851 stop:132684 length:834 start_codon:yes stop_codon:yes gene_type:complete